jgi:hypothetical protein
MLVSLMECIVVAPSLVVSRRINPICLVSSGRRTADCLAIVWWNWLCGVRDLQFSQRDVSSYGWEFLGKEMDTSEIMNYGLLEYYPAFQLRFLRDPSEQAIS